MTIQIRDATPEEADTLTAIAIRAKSYWGYTDEQIALWREFLTFTPDYVRENRVWVALVDRQIVGVVAIETHDDAVVLEHLWVLPEMIGKGIGKTLFEYIASQESDFTFTSDPHADPFYIKMGAYKIGEYESLIQNRTLTHFRYSRKK